MTAGGAPWPRPRSFGADAAVSAILTHLMVASGSRPARSGVDPADIARWSRDTGLAPPRLLDRLAAEVALGFHAGQFGYEVCDRVVNALHGTLYRDPPGPAADWPDLFWQTYLAFDAGEYTRQGRPGENPVEVHTRPQIAALVERLLPDGGWHAMFRDAPAHRFVEGHGELRIETGEFSCSPTETMPTGRIVIAGIRCVHREGEVSAAFGIESDDAEVYGIDGLPGGVRLFLVWRFWKPKAPDVHRTYWFPVRPCVPKPSRVVS